MHAQYFALINLNPKLCAKAIFSLLLILLAWDGDCDVELGLVVVVAVPRQAHAPQLGPGLTRLYHEVPRLVFPLLFLLSASTHWKKTKQCLLSISRRIRRREKLVSAHHQSFILSSQILSVHTSISNFRHICHCLFWLGK